MSPSGRILYTRDERFPKGAWGLVAGYIELGETAEAAALREVEEESGLGAREPRIVGTDSFRENLLVCVRVDIDDAAVSPEPGTDVALDVADAERVVPATPAARLVAALLAGRL